MKFGKNLYLATTVVVALSWFAAGFIAVLASLYSFGGVGRLVVSTCCILAAVGVILLGWYWLRLRGAITSTAKHLKAEGPSHIKAGGNAIINELNEAINHCLINCAGYNRQLEEKIENLQIRIQISQRQKQNTEAIVHSIRDAVLVIDEFDRLQMANTAAQKLFKFDFDTSKQKSIDEIISENRKFVDLLRKSKQGKARHTKHEIEFTEDTDLKIFDCIFSCAYDERQQVCGVVAVLHDVTREKEISKMKNDFVSHVSHELKTPLASITAYSEMLADGEAKDSKSREEFCSVIQNQAKRLNRLIEDILNISRIESGLIKVDKKPVSLTLLIEEQIQMIKSYAEEKNIRIIKRKPIVFEQVYADKDMISQVIVNLLSNAVKYTKAGGSIKTEIEVDEIASLARVSITDTGVGIPQDDIEHVFDKFYRVSANNSQAKGTGLGLHLVKQIIENVHNGRVFVESSPGAGSTFGFELPLAAQEAVGV